VRNAFGQLIGDPLALPREERIDELRRVAGRLQAANDPGSRWFGAVLLDWLHSGGDFQDVLAVRPPKGSRRTVSALLTLGRRDAALLRLANAVGCDRTALRILRGAAECPSEHALLLAEAQALRVPMGAHAISRARRRYRSRLMT